MSKLTIEDWIALGVDMGWASEVHCATHAGVKNVGDEAERWDEGYDPCQLVVRILPGGSDA